MKAITSKSTLNYGLLYDFGHRNLAPLAAFGLSEGLLRFVLSGYSYQDMSLNLYVYFYFSRRLIPFRDFLRKYHDTHPEELEAISPGFYSNFVSFLSEHFGY